MGPDMKLMPARISISVAGLSYCCIDMMPGRYETFMSPFHAGMKSEARIKMG